jgi:hypothetical protein
VRDRWLVVTAVLSAAICAGSLIARSVLLDGDWDTTSAPVVASVSAEHAIALPSVKRVPLRSSPVIWCGLGDKSCSEWIDSLPRYSTTLPTAAAKTAPITFARRSYADFGASMGEYAYRVESFDIVRVPSLVKSACKGSTCGVWTDTVLRIDTVRKIDTIRARVIATFGGGSRGVSDIPIQEFTNDLDRTNAATAVPLKVKPRPTAPRRGRDDPNSFRIADNDPLKKELSLTGRGLARLKAPRAMRVGVPGVATITVVDKSDSLREEADSMVTSTRSTRIAKRMRARLTASDFLIEPQGDSIQFVAPGEGATWTFRLTPLAAGQKDLLATVGIALGSGTAAILKDYTTQLRVQVEINIPYTVWKNVEQPLYDWVFRGGLVVFLLTAGRAGWNHWRRQTPDTLTK